MKKTKILTFVVLSTLLTTSVYAKGDCIKQNMYEKKHCMPKSKMEKRNKNSVMSLIKQLNLTKEQRLKIRQIKKDVYKNRISINLSFSKDSFNKEKFIELMSQKRNNMIELKASMLEKIYKILTKEQKEQLKVLIDLKTSKISSKIKKGRGFDRNCNDRG